MLYQIGLIVLIVYVALVLSKRFNYLRNCLQANTTIRANGTPVITTEV